MHVGFVVRPLDREHQLDALVEVARHPVGARQVDLLVAAVQEVVDARVLEEAIDDGDDLDVVADAGTPGRSAQMPRTFSRMRTPARDAA